MDDNKINFTLNGQPMQAEKGETIFKVGHRNGIFIPTLCYDDRLKLDGSCRLCVVEVAGARTLLPACSTEVAEGMAVLSHSHRVIKARRDILMLLLSDHPRDCLVCDHNGRCKLQTLCSQYNIDDYRFGWLADGEHRSERDVDESSPFFIIDRRRCILCGRCVRVCNDFMGVGAINMGHRGSKTVVSTPFLEDLSAGRCVSCGNCLSVCPTGALSLKKQPELGLEGAQGAVASFFGRKKPRRVTTTCPYCGVGCQMSLVIKGARVIEVEPLRGAANSGLLCVKGKFGHRFLGHPDRLKTPLIKIDGKFQEATWDEAISYITIKAKAIRARHGSWHFGGLSSARCTNEENYLMQKMARAVFKTNDIDHCARLCHSSTVAGLAATLGSGAMTNSIEEALRSEVIFIIGSNTSETHPVIGAHIRQAQMHNKTKVIVADPRKIDLAITADCYLPIKAGSNIALLNAMMKVILDENLHNRAFIAAHTEGFEELAAHLARLDFNETCAICGVDPQEVRRAARLYATASSSGLYYSMGVTQFASGTNGVMSVSNLALLCGQIGKESAGVNPLRGQNNVQGACDMGALPNVFTSYQSVTSPENRTKFEKAWNVVGLPDQVGLTLTQMMETLGDRIKFLYIMGENPMVSDPDSHHIHHALSSLDLLVVQDIFLTETAKMADVVLPAAAFAEKDGTFTSTERRVQLIRKAIDPPGGALPDWQILVRIMKAFGYASPDYQSASDIFEELRAISPSYAGMTHKRLDNLAGLQWPCPTEDHPGTKYLHKDGKFTRGKGLFKAISYTHPVEEPDQAYPLVLTTGRNLYQYHTRTMTSKVEGLTAKAGESYVEIGPATAAQYGVSHGDMVRVSSPRGNIEVKARVLPRVRDGLIFVPFHYGQDGANILTVANLDPVCRIPELKVLKARIEKLADAAPEV